MRAAGVADPPLLETVGTVLSRHLLVSLSADCSLSAPGCRLLRRQQGSLKPPLLAAPFFSRIRSIPCWQIALFRHRIQAVARTAVDRPTNRFFLSGRSRSLKPSARFLVSGLLTFRTATRFFR